MDYKELVIDLIDSFEEKYGMKNKIWEYIFVFIYHKLQGGS